MCLCAKFDQFLPIRSHFDTKRPVNFFHIATFPSPTFGPLFAFHCPLFFMKNNNLQCRDVLKMVTVTTQDRPLNCKQQQWFSDTVLDSDLSDLSSNLIQVLHIFLTHYCLRLTTFTFNKWREYNYDLDMNNGQEWVDRISKISSPGNRYMAPPPPTKTAHFGQDPFRPYAAHN